MKDALSRLVRERLEAFSNLTIPSKHKEALRNKTRIFCDVSRYPENTPATYHPSSLTSWLEDHLEPDYKRCSINITNASWFLSHASNGGFFPDTLLHELSHSFHDQILPHGFDNQQIAEAFRQAAGNFVYSGTYSLSNSMEYFACASTAYWGRNSFLPLNRSDLLRLDPAGHALVAALWA